jgi:DNA-binding GntR family transcriptional regulator
MSSPKSRTPDAGIFKDFETKPVRSDPLSSQVSEIIRDAIFKGKISPGEMLPEARLAKTFGVSQSTVREALTQLEHAGLVLRMPNRGTMVTQLSGKEVRDLLKIRLVLEELAAAEACTRINIEGLTRLEEINASIERAAAANSCFDVVQADLEFHRQFWRASGNAALCRHLDVLSTPLLAFLGLQYRIASVDLQNLQPHAEIIEALRSRDIEAARMAIRNHIDNSYGLIIRAQDQALEQPISGMLR